MKPAAMLELLGNAEAAGLFFATKRELLAAELAAKPARFHLWKLDLTGLSRTEDLLETIGEALTLPQWYGKNWDALSDCLNDLSWSKAEGYVLVLRDVQALHSAAPDVCETLLDVLRESSDIWRTEGTPFWVLLDAPLKDISPLSAQA